MYENYEKLVGNNNVELPQYFLCPISLQIMIDPVITTTGITYDRHSIHQWLTTANPPVCPVTKRALNSHDLDLPVLTPNHTLRRLIHSWSAANSASRDMIPAENVISLADVINILRGVFIPRLHSASLDQLLAIANSDVEEHVSNRSALIECGTPKALVLFIIKCYKENKILGLEKALRILNSIWVPTSQEINDLVGENRDLIDSLTWVLNYKSTGNDFDTLKNLTILIVKEVIKVASSSFIIDRVNREFFHGVVGILKQRDKIVGPTKAAVQVMLELSQHGRNKYKLIESNVVFELIQLELDLGMARPELKKLTELVFALLAQLCSCAEGRAQLLAHAGGIFVVANRILRVSPVVDDRAVHILSQISKNNAATTEMLKEMVKVGVVSKLCMVLQADCGKYLKEKVRGILKRHSNVWRYSPCFEVPRLSS